MQNVNLCKDYVIFALCIYFTLHLHDQTVPGDQTDLKNHYYREECKTDDERNAKREKW